MTILRKLALPVAAIALVAPACGLGNKQQQADIVANTREKAFAADGATGLLRIEITPDEDSIPTTGEGETPAGGGQAPGAGQGQAEGGQGGEGGGAAALLGGGQGAAIPRTLTLALEAQLSFDFKKKSVQMTLAQPPANPLAALAGGGEGEGAAPADPAAAAAPAPEAAQPTGPTALFHHDTIFVRRSNVRPTERRLWAKLDFRRLDDDEPVPDPEELPGYGMVIAAANSINPIYILELVEGVLAGSIKAVGNEDVAGVKTTKYEANISTEKALTDLKLEDRELETRELMFRLLREYGDVRPAMFWVDDQGMLRRVTFQLEQTIDRNQQNKLDITLEFHQFGPPAPVPVPTKEETIELQRYGRMVRNVLPARA